MTKDELKKVRESLVNHRFNEVEAFLDKLDIEQENEDIKEDWRDLYHQLKKIMPKWKEISDGPPEDSCICLITFSPYGESMQAAYGKEYKTWTLYDSQERRPLEIAPKYYFEIPPIPFKEEQND